LQVLKSKGPQMALTDVKIRAAKPKPTAYKLADEKGLYLLIGPSGSKLWRLKFRLNGREKKLAIGAYPEMCLNAARAKREESRSMIAGGADPAVTKQSQKVAAKMGAATTFLGVAKEYIEKTAREGRAEATVAKVLLGARTVDSRAWASPHCRY
jgi:hypothetical protein